MDLGKAFKRYGSVVESFVHKTRSKKNTDLISEPSFVPDNGVYILHETLGVKTVEGWNPKFNNGVIGILVIEDEHQLVVALEDSPKKLQWSKDCKLVNQPIKNTTDAKSDFNGEEYCRNLNSPDFPAAYYCSNYKKGNRSWYLPSSGELWLIYNHLEEIQNALSIVGGQKFVTTWDEDVPVYWSSTESSAAGAWYLHLIDGSLYNGYGKVSNKVRPVSNFRKKNTLKESFTKKISSKKNTELTSKPSFVIDNGVYILHETLGVRGVEGWNPKNNNGVVGILLVEDDHKIVVALEDSPEDLPWSNEYGLINHPFENRGEAKSEFNGEEHCRKLNSPVFPAAYYCLNYNKGGRDWYLPSSGELWLIYRHLEEIQTALSIVRGQKFVTTWDDETPCYWSSTEYSATRAWHLFLHNGNLCNWYDRVIVAYSCKVRPISKFQPFELKESFTRKISSKKNNELIAKSDTAFVPDGVYILHETLGVKTVDGWNPKNNDGVVGILLVEDDHKIVVALEDAPEKLTWSNEYELINESIEKDEDAESDFNGEEHCIKFNSTDFPAAYYCKTYNKGGRSWYLPSSGELWMIYSHFDEIQNALSIVGGQKFVTTWDDENDVPVYWSSTENSDTNAWYLTLASECLGWFFYDKVSDIPKVRPVSKFDFSTLKESFTRKIRSKKNDELTTKADTAFVPDGVYILHETLGVKGVEGWNPKNNNGVVGVLVVEDEHKIVISTEDAPVKLKWSKESESVNQPVENIEDAESDFNGEEHCIKFNSTDFPAAYYCLNYKKGNRNWYLPSSGELWLICRHLEEIQNALETVGGKKFVTVWDDDVPMYWSSTDYCAKTAWALGLDYGTLNRHLDKVGYNLTVRPVSKFDFSTLKESFTRKISSKKNNELIAKSDTAFVPDGVYILHETLGVKTLEKWSKKLNNGVVGILLIEDDHKIVVATKDAPKKLIWSKKRGLINQSIEELEDAESDFNGEMYCRKLGSPDFPAVYYCKTYNKGGRNWYLPSSGELWLIYNHLEEIQNALSIVGGQKFVTTWNDVPWYWSSTEYNYTRAWHLYFYDGNLCNWYDRVNTSCKVRPISKFQPSELKESFTKKIGKKNVSDIIGKSERVFLEESITQMVYSFGKYDMVQDIDKKHILGYELPYGCLPKFFESKKFVDNGDVIKRTETCSPMGYTLRYEIVASHIYFNPLRKKVYVGMYRPSPLNQSESSPKIYNLYGAASSGILELDDFSIDELRQILQNIQERTKMKKPLRKKIVLKR